MNKFEQPIMNITVFDSENIVTTSGSSVQNAAADKATEVLGTASCLFEFDM